jgi:hypothetical protein
MPKTWAIVVLMRLDFPSVRPLDLTLGFGAVGLAGLQITFKGLKH